VHVELGKERVAALLRILQVEERCDDAVAPWLEVLLRDVEV
jgi:hypothetical protein